MDDKNEELKKVELNILKAFIHVCNENNLKYFLLGGSCLGAIRHSGFIPWDDDIDVGLPREDYNRLMEIGQGFLPDFYFLQNYNTDPEYYRCFAKIRDSRTTFVESSVKSSHINHGVYIDVFPLDYYPDHGIKRFKFKQFLYNARLMSQLDISPSVKMKVLMKTLNILSPDVGKTVKKMDMHMQSIHKSGYMANICGAWGEKEISPVEWFGEGQTAKFEGVEVRVPSDYDKYLSKLYGDYMTPPPAEKRVGHHYTEIIDLEKPYTYYTSKKT